MESDIAIAQNTEPKRIRDIAETLGIREEDLLTFGPYKAKVDHRLLERLKNRKEGRLILVTAINPTPAGEGKTTTAVGLGDALKTMGKKAVIALREPSLGPVFGMKGGATGGGYAQVIPMEEINLHFTGDINAVGAANNLLAAMVDNHIYHGNRLNIDPRRITWRRVMDINDRQLRYLVSGLGGRMNGVPREDRFDITVASEIMAVFCLARSIPDLKERISRIVVASTTEGRPVTAGDLEAQGALTALMKDAFHPNLVQSLEGTPAFIHGGPFANIAHGCNSMIATKLALKLADYVVTEAGFGADLGAEKFIDIKCRMGGLRPDAVVLVASIRALKHHGGCPKEQWDVLNLALLKKGLGNLEKHLENITEVYGLPVVVAINRFPGDQKSELKMVSDRCGELGAAVAVSDVFAEGGEGGIDLACKVLSAVKQPNRLRYVYPLDRGIRDKIALIARDVYGADGVNFSGQAQREIDRYEAMGYGDLPVCMAKTQYSFSEDPALLGRPTGFKINVRQTRLYAGAGFVVAVTGDIMTMPGLPKSPAAEKIDVDDDGRISGLF